MNILLIGLHYHDYTSAITEELRALGHAIRLHELQPRNLVMKALRIVAPKLWQARLDAHHRAILRAEYGRPTDLVLFIQVHQMRYDRLCDFRRSFPDARFALYNWDSLANHDYLRHSRCFDTVQTFDPIDASRYGFTYLPLFASRRFQVNSAPVSAARSVYFVGNIVSPNRYRMLDAFRHYCEARAIAFRSYMACTPVVRTRLHREGIRPSELQRGPIAEAEFQELLQDSNATFDYANHDQTGYTMRVIENLCARRKIITNNARIRQESFYSPDRIHVFSEGDDFEGVDSFLDAPLAAPERTFPEYHIQSFVRHLIEGTGHAIRTG